MVQAGNATLGMGIAGLSSVWMKLAELGYQWLKPLKLRLAARHGMFLTDPVVFYLALLPWKLDLPEKDVTPFLENVLLLMIKADPVPDNRDTSNTSRVAVIRSFQHWITHEVPSMIGIREDLHTPARFEILWRLNLKDKKLKPLAEFALRLSRFCVSEAHVERVFSKLKYVMNDLKASTSASNVRDTVSIAMKEQTLENFEATQIPSMQVPIKKEFLLGCIKAHNEAVKDGVIVLPPESELPQEEEQNQRRNEPVVLDGAADNVQCVACFTTLPRNQCVSCNGKPNLPCAQNSYLCNECVTANHGKRCCRTCSK